ncbi:MAG TPA: hypothetical protein VMW75_09830 [Thermoanaerobaculia bacterium]|nr:hypothetical protein [Thermoanaerobaculia bacterium]
MSEIRPARRPFSWSSIAAFVVEAVAACGFVIAVYEVVVAGGLALLPKPGGNWILVLLIAATAIAGSGMGAVRRWARALARRVLPASDPYATLMAFVSGAAAAGAVENALPRLAELLAEGGGARSAAVWLAVPSGLRCASSWPEGSWPDGSQPDGAGPQTVAGEVELEAIADYVAPVRHGGRVLGALALRARAGGFLALPDVRLAADMANAAGQLLRNEELTEQLRERLRVEKVQADELAASRRRIVVARDVAREQLSAEIQARVCEPLERSAERVERALLAPDGAEAGLAEIAPEIDAAIGDFRRIVHGVYPPVLTDHGLRAAMENLLAELEPGASLLPYRIPRLADRVELGTYFCAAALLRDWQDSGSLRPMTVMIGVSSSRIEMTFVDGVSRTPARPELPVSPLVLEAVRDRVAAMGGGLQIQGEDSGRLLVIDLPLVTADLAAARGNRAVR